MLVIQLWALIPASTTMSAQSNLTRNEYDLWFITIPTCFDKVNASKKKAYPFILIDYPA